MGIKKETTPLTEDQRKLVGEHLETARYLASKRFNPFVPPEDMLQFAYLGLIDAAKRYDASKGFTFKTYAVQRINGEISEWIRSTAGTIKIGRAGRRKGIVTRRLKSLDVLASRKEEMGEVEEINIDRSPDFADAVDRRDAVDKALAVLTERERYVVTRYTSGEATMGEIARDVGRHQSRVSQLMLEILGRLRRHSALKEYAPEGIRPDWRPRMTTTQPKVKHRAPRRRQQPRTDLEVVKRDVLAAIRRIEAAGRKATVDAIAREVVHGAKFCEIARIELASEGLWIKPTGRVYRPPADDAFREHPDDPDAAEVQARIAAIRAVKAAQPTDAAPVSVRRCKAVDRWEWTYPRRFS